MDALVAQARAAMATGSRSFAAASRLFAPSVREDAWLLYAWCRHCDDQVDGQELGHGTETVDEASRRARLARLQARTRLALSGAPMDGDVPFAGLQRVAQRHGMPASLPLAHLEGFAMDVAGHAYEREGDLLTYCYHVAGVVGVMMAMVMGARDEDVLDRACDLGIAFQLTNIARDLVEDAGNGRVYVPRAWLEAEGLDARSLADPARRESLARLARRLLDAAEPYYASAAVGIAALPWRSAWAVAVARAVYRDIGVLVRARGPRAWDTRAVVPGRRKLARVAQGLAAALGSRVPGRRVASRHGLWTRPRVAVPAGDAAGRQPAAGASA